jgi:lysophospholipase L1-like esterase
MRTKAFRFVLPLAAVFAALAIAEVALRLSGFGASTVYLHAGILRHHPLLGWEKKPSARAVYEFEGKTIVETSNRDGFRGPARPREKPPGEFRVLALGDSFCEGYLVGDGEVFSAVLERKWQNSRKLSVINAGVAGYSTDQQLMYFRETGVMYQPDVTVVFFFDNDVWFNTQVDEYRSKKPRFVLSEGGLAIDGLPVPPPPERAASAAPESRGFFRDHFRLAQFIADRAARIPWLQTGSIPPPSAQAPQPEAAAAAPSRLPGEFKVYLRQQPEDIREAWRVTEAILREFKGDAEAAGGRLAVFYVPTAAAIYPQAWDAAKRRWGLNGEAWSIEQVEPTLAAVCQRQGIDFIPAIAPLREIAGQPEFASSRLYYLEDGHWNAAGHAAAAEILRQYLSSLNP